MKIGKAESTDLDDVLVERIGDVACVRMNRPSVSNAVGPATMLRLCAALDQVISNPAVKAIVLTHQGKHFIAGADFAFLDDLTRTPGPDATASIYEAFQGAAKRLHLCRKPTVAAIGGAAITVGCELAIACDFRIVTEAAIFQESWIRLGLLPPLGGFKVLPALVGMDLARKMILRAMPVRGAQAVECGLASELVAPEALESSAITLAQELAALAPLSYQACKEGLRRGQESTLDESWAHNLLAQGMLIVSEDFREGVRAVQERRTPHFKGR
jgi:enoyl-CoA hydratase/carnithine racemase